MVKERTPPPDGVQRPDPPPAPSAAMPTREDWEELTRAHLAGMPHDRTDTGEYLERIATSLERIVELMEATMEPDDVIAPNVIVDRDGKLMHVTGTCQPETPDSPTDLGAYVLAHDPDHATRAAKAHWNNQGHVGITNVKAAWDD